MVIEGLIQLLLGFVYKSNAGKLVSFTLFSTYLCVDIESLLVVIERLVQVPLGSVYEPDVT